MPLAAANCGGDEDTAANYFAKDVYTKDHPYALAGGDKAFRFELYLFPNQMFRVDYTSIIPPTTFNLETSSSLGRGGVVVTEVESNSSAAEAGLKDDDLRDAPTFASVAAEVASHLRDTVVVCHNAQFDMQFLDSEFRRLGREIQIPNLIDTLFMAREHFDFASYSLTNIATEFNVQNPEAHRALESRQTIGKIVLRP